MLPAIAERDMQAQRENETFALGYEASCLELMQLVCRLRGARKSWSLAYSYCRRV
jgi:hypothetical protein